ncbi:unnamed protein product [Amoebophrya sp. A120]|nr:unnamed protein product [Amoebophrya sp. A120]|eukprot:GSA120T00014301001.1
MATQAQIEAETNALIASMTEDQLMQFGEDDTVKGNLVFKPATSALPNTQRSADLKQKKIDLIKRRRQEAEDEKKRKEQEEAQRRLKEQEAKKLKAEQERRRKEEERRKREEEEQRAKMEGGLDQLMGHLVANTSVENVSCAGIELGSVRLRLLAQALEKNTSCVSIDLSRKGLNDEDGVTLAKMLHKNDSLRKMDLEGNNLGVKAAAAFGEALTKNERVFCLNLEANNLVVGGQDSSGIVELAKGLRKNQDVQILALAKNGLGPAAADAFNDALDFNNVLTQLDLSHNDIPPFTQQKIEAKMEKNRERASALRRQERREKFHMYAEEFQSRQFMMQVEAMRLEMEAVQERRLARLRERLVKWNVQSQEEEKQLEDLLEDLMTEYEERKAARKGKKGKKGKK